MNYHIGEYEVKTGTHELLHKGSPQDVEPLIFKLLIFLLNNPNRLITRDELIKSVWNSHFISDSALNASISNARKAIGDSAKSQHCIKTVSGSGYRFIANFTSSFNKKKHICQEEFDLKNPTLPAKPSLAVMDFIDQKPTEKSQLFTKAMTSEINSGLARLPHLFVIARPSASNLSKQKLLPNKISQRLGVRYLIYGNSIISSNRMNITLTIVDAVTNTEIWSENFSHLLDDIWLIQDEIIKTIVMLIDSKIEQAEIERAFLTPSDNLSAWENFHRGLWHMDRTTMQDIDVAQHYFKQAIKEDTRFSKAYAGLSYTYTSRTLLHHTKITRSNKAIIQAIKYAKYSLDYCNKEVMGSISLSRALLFSRQIDQAISRIDQAIGHSPNSPILFLFKSLAFVKLEANDIALNAIEYGERLNPAYPMATVSFNLSRAMMLCSKKKYQEAALLGINACDINDSYYFSHALTSACLQLAGDTEKAQKYASTALELLPECTIDSCERALPIKEKSKAVFVRALIAAGIPKAN